MPNTARGVQRQLLIDDCPLGLGSISRTPPLGAMMNREVVYGEGGEAGTPTLYQGVQARSSEVGPYRDRQGSCGAGPGDSSERAEALDEAVRSGPGQPFS